jgi:hypothetical protein
MKSSRLGSVSRHRYSCADLGVDLCFVLGSSAGLGVLSVAPCWLCVIVIACPRFAGRREVETKPQTDQQEQGREVQEEDNG